MNAVQWVSLARAIVILLGGIAVGLGWATEADVDAISKPEVLTPIVGAAAAVVVIVYGWRARRTSAISDAAVKLDPQGVASRAAAADPNAVVAAAATVPGVESIVASPHIANAVPNAKVVSAR